MTEVRATAKSPKSLNFKETMAARVQNDPAFAQAVLDEAITLFVGGEPESVKRILSCRVDASVSDVSGIIANLKRFLQVEVRARVAMV